MYSLLQHFASQLDLEVDRFTPVSESTDILWFVTKSIVTQYSTLINAIYLHIRSFKESVPSCHVLHILSISYTTIHALSHLELTFVIEAS